MVEEPRSSTPSAREFRELVGQSPARAATLARDAHPADVVAWLSDLGEEDAWQVFASLGTEMRAAVLEYADEMLRERLVPRLTASDLTDIVDELPPDEAVDVLAAADGRVSEDVLEAIPSERAEDLRELSSWPPESAGGVMTSDYVAVPRGTRVGDAIKLIKEGEGPPDSVGVFVVDAAERPVGFLDDRDLLTHSIHESVDGLMGDPITVRADGSHTEVASRIARYGLSALAVVDADGRLVGVISPEDAQEIYEREFSKDILRIGGTQPAHQPTRRSIPHRVRRRLPVMLVTVVGGLATARLLELILPSTSGASSGATAVLRYLPIVIGLAGNVGIQASTILVRAFATGEVDRERELAVLGAEVAVGGLLGLICGSATTAVSTWFESGTAWLGGTHAIVFGTVLGAAVAVAVTWASLLGCIIPMACRRMGIDPAIVAGPFLISVSDVSGSAIYIVVASTALERLLA